MILSRENNWTARRRRLSRRILDQIIITQREEKGGRLPINVWSVLLSNWKSGNFLTVFCSSSSEWLDLSDCQRKHEISLFTIVMLRIRLLIGFQSCSSLFAATSLLSISLSLPTEALKCRKLLNCLFSVVFLYFIIILEVLKISIFSTQ